MEEAENKRADATQAHGVGGTAQVTHKSAADRADLQQRWTGQISALGQHMEPWS